MVTLSSIYNRIYYDCYKDDRGVYLDGQQVAVSNSENVGYTRINGKKKVEKIGNEAFRVVYPKVFVGSVVGGNENVLLATLCAVAGGTVVFKSATMDKYLIGQEEGIDISKFTGVALVRIEYEETTTQSYCAIPTPIPVVRIFDATFDASFN